MSESSSSQPDPKPESRARISGVDAQHATIKMQLTKLESTTNLPEVAQQLSELRVLLEEHFKAEGGEDGLHRVVEEFAPRHMPHVQRLLEEHEHFLSDLEKIQQDIRDILECKTQQICDDVSAFADKLREHEKQEDQIFDDALYTDRTGGHS